MLPGASKTNPQLLDYPPCRSCKMTGPVKKLIKQIVMSRAYQLDSRSDRANAEIDPDNTMVWHMSKLRLDAEAIRDGMLSISDALDRSAPKTSPVAKAGEGPSQFLVRLNFREFDGRTRYRSVYMPILRDQLPEVLSLLISPIRVCRPVSEW